MGADAELGGFESVGLGHRGLGAVQAIEGRTHRRGTPSAVVETDPATWVRLATGSLTWAEALAGGLLHASGERSDLSGLLPLYRFRGGETLR